MSKYVLYGLVGYSLIISILLMTKGCERSSETDLTLLEREADSLRIVNKELEKDNVQWISKFDSVGIRLNRIDQGLIEIQNQKVAVKEKYDVLFDNLSGLSQDSLKAVALDK